jgi:hypothetical protein
MSCFGKQVDVPGGKRKAARQRMVAVGSAVSVQGSRSIIVENIGVSGAKVRGHGLPPIGRQVLIWMDEFDILGSVVWARFGERGIAFDAALETAALRNLEKLPLFSQPAP